MTNENRQREIWHEALRTERGSTNSAFKAMDAWAKIIAISFKEWQDFNLEGAKWENYDGRDTWINPHTRQVRSTSQLYDIYKSQSNVNK